MTTCRCVAVFAECFCNQNTENQKDSTERQERHSDRTKGLSDVSRPNGRRGSSRKYARDMKKEEIGVGRRTLGSRTDDIQPISNKNQTNQ